MQRALPWLVLLTVALCGIGEVTRAEETPSPPGETTDSPATDSQAGEGPSTDFPATGPVLQRSSLIDAVVESNPSLEAARQAWKATAERVDQATSLDDPVASFSLAPLSFESGTRAGLGAGLRQRVPYPGTLRLRGRVAESSARAARYGIDRVRLDLAAHASYLFHRYWRIDRELEITQEHIELLEIFRRIATDRYATGEAPQQAPLRAEVEAAHLRHRRVVLRSERRSVVARLNALLHRPPAASLPPPPEHLGAGEPERSLSEASSSEAPSSETRSSEARATGDPAPARPVVAARRAEIEALGHEIALRELRFKPDFELTTSVSSMWATDEHRWMVGVGVRIPLGRERLRASVAESEARLAESESELAALSDAVAAEVEIARAAIEEAEHVVRLYRSRLLPAARDQVAAARSAFETGLGSMLDLVDAQRSLLGSEVGHEEAVAELASARVELDRALGRMPGARARRAPASNPSPATERNPRP